MFSSTVASWANSAVQFGLTQVRIFGSGVTSGGLKKPVPISARRTGRPRSQQGRRAVVEHNQVRFDVLEQMAPSLSQRRQFFAVAESANVQNLGERAGWFKVAEVLMLEGRLEKRNPWIR